MNEEIAMKNLYFENLVNNIQIHMEDYKNKIKDNFLKSIDEYQEDLKEIDLIEIESNFIEMINITNYHDRRKKWESICEKIMKLDLDKRKYVLCGLANPYYIGVGNPHSKVLFIRQEKAFNPGGNEFYFEDKNGKNIDKLFA